jgi:hypothetical protein
VGEVHVDGCGGKAAEAAHVVGDAWLVRELWEIRPLITTVSIRAASSTSIDPGEERRSPARREEFKLVPLS